VARADLGMPPRKKAKPKKARDFELRLGDAGVAAWLDFHADKLMPFAGGTWDQPEMWHEDVETLDWEYAVIRDKLKRGQSTAPPTDDTEPKKPAKFEDAFAEKP
jgi:hypothetical protein